MDTIQLKKMMYSVIVVLIVNGLFTLLKLSARKTQQKFGIRKSRYFAIRRLMIRNGDGKTPWIREIQPDSVSSRRL